MGELVQFLVDRRLRKTVYSGPFGGGGSDFAEEVKDMFEKHFREEVQEMVNQPDPVRRSRIVHT